MQAALGNPAERGPARLAGSWSYLTSLTGRLDGSVHPLADFRAALADGDRELARRFRADEPIDTLVRDRAALVDALVTLAWRLHAGPGRRLLLAVGGCGRASSCPA